MEGLEMRIGIDFGTSYTAAAAYINGSIQHILFRGEASFVRLFLFLKSQST